MMTRITLVLLLLVSLVVTVQAQAPLKTEVLHWPEGKAAAVALTFDDNVLSQLTTAIPELEKHGYRGTFFIVAQWLDLPASEEGLAVQWQQVARRGHEIGCHTYSHAFLTSLPEEALQRQIQDAKGIIEHWIGEGNCRMFRAPSATSPAAEKLIRELFPLNAVNLGRDDKVICTVPRTYGDVKRQIDQTIADRGIYLPIWHGVGADFTKISTEDFQHVLQYLDERRAVVWVATMSEVARYVGLRQQAVVSSEGGIHLVLPPGMDIKRFNVPLWLRTTVPAEWTTVCLRRGLSCAVVPTVAAPGGRIIDYLVAPGETWSIERYTPIDTTALKLTNVATASFDTPETLKTWTVISGKAQVADGVVRLENGSGLLLNDLQLADGQLRGRFRLTDDPALRKYACWAGLLFRVRAVWPANGYTGLFYELANQPEYSDFRPNRVLLWQQLGYKEPTWPNRLCGSGASEQPSGAWHTFEVTIQGDRLRYLVDGKLVFHLAGLDPAAGQVGLRAMNSAVEFDDIVVSRIEP